MGRDIGDVMIIMIQMCGKYGQLWEIGDAIVLMTQTLVGSMGREIGDIMVITGQNTFYRLEISWVNNTNIDGKYGQLGWR